jgi:6-phosphogluconolactonase
MSVTAFTYDAAHGSLKEIQTISTLPKDFKGQNLSTAEAEIDPKGKFLYVSNRGPDSIAIFAIGGDGKLKVVDIVSTQGKTPRNFKIDPTGNYLLAANRGTNNIVQFASIPNRKADAYGKTIEVGSPVSRIRAD